MLKKKKKNIYIYIYIYICKKNYINYYIKFNMFYNHPDLKKMSIPICVCIYIYILLKNILYTKLTNFDYLNKNVEQLYLRIIRI